MEVMQDIRAQSDKIKQTKNKLAFYLRLKTTVLDGMSATAVSQLNYTLEYTKLANKFLVYDYPDWRLARDKEIETIEKIESIKIKLGIKGLFIKEEIFVPHNDHDVKIYKDKRHHELY